MRLYPDEIDALKFALKKVRGEVYLFGSRVNDREKGGDIDILIFSSDSDYELSLNIKCKKISKCEMSETVLLMIICPNNEKNV